MRKMTARFQMPMNVRRMRSCVRSVVSRVGGTSGARNRGAGAGGFGLNNMDGTDIKMNVIFFCTWTHDTGREWKKGRLQNHSLLFQSPFFWMPKKYNNPRPHISNVSARRRCVTGGMKTPHKNRKHWGGGNYTQYSNISPEVAWGLLPIGGPPGNPSGGYASGFDPLRR